MGYVSIAVLLVLGFLGAINLIAAKKPEAKGLADKLAPYQGWIGAGAAVWGLFWLIRWFQHGLDIMSFAPVYSITFLASALLLIGLGCLFGISVFKQFLKADDAKAKLDGLAAKLRPVQGAMGLAAIGVGMWFLVASVFNIAI